MFKQPTARPMPGDDQLSHVSEFENERPIALVVEDDDIDATTLECLLRSLGVNIVRAACSKVAISALITCKFDFIFVEVDLPSSEGYSVIKSIRTSELNRSQPTIVASTFDTVEVRMKTLSIGADEFLVKPLRRESLQCALMNAVARRRVATGEPSSAYPEAN